MKNRTVIGIICIGVAMLISFVGIPLAARRADATVEIVRTLAAVEKGQPVRADMLETVRVGKSGLPEGILTDVKDAVGKYASCDMVRGDWVTSSKLTTDAVSAAGALRRLAPGELAVTVAVTSFADGFSGQLTNGDIVSVYVTSSKIRAFSPPALRYLRVITTVTGGGVNRDGAGSDGQGEYELPETIMFAVNPEQAAELFEYSGTASVCCAFVCHGSDPEAASYLEQQRQWFLRGEDTGTGTETEDAQGAGGGGGVISEAAAIISGEHTSPLIKESVSP
ncbi:MAG: hypothetical protein II534_01635 [Clostridia bacterium]|nr:hypothetical protein [Clostridia bacterium]